MNAFSELYERVHDDRACVPQPPSIIILISPKKHAVTIPVIIAKLIQSLLHRWPNSRWNDFYMI